MEVEHEKHPETYQENVLNILKNDEVNEERGKVLGSDKMMDKSKDKEEVGGIDNKDGKKMLN